MVVGLLVQTGMPVAAHQPEGRVVDAVQLRGLRATQTGPCAGGYRIAATDLCTHGPDARPAGRRLALQPRSLSATVRSALPETVLCDGDGESGRRVQAIYARTAGTASRRSTVIPTIRTAAAGVQSAFLASAAKTGGVRRPRWVTDDDCRLKVIEVVLSQAAGRSFGTTVAELQSLGHARDDRKYLIWFDTDVYCGIGTFWGDDRPTADNLSNTTVGYGRADTRCWGWAETHELMHTLGAVQNSAPNTTWNVAPNAFGHCTDEYDVMCYADAPGVTTRIRCPDVGLDGLFDCGNDDYFHTHPKAGSYLGTHWNSADSAWLERTVVELAAPVPGLAAGATVARSKVPVVTSLTSRAPLAGIETLEVEQRVAGQPWRIVDAAPGARAVDSRLTVGASTRYRVRSVAGTGDAGPWRMGPTVVSGLRDDTHRALRWSRGWQTRGVAGALDGSLRRGSRAGASVRITTEARQVGIVAGRGPLAGRLEVRVDGRRVRIVDLSRATSTQRTIAAVITLRPGTHTVELRVLAPRSSTPGWRVEVDALVLLDR